MDIKFTIEWRENEEVQRHVIASTNLVQARTDLERLFLLSSSPDILYTITRVGFKGHAVGTREVMLRSIRNGSLLQEFKIEKVYGRWVQDGLI